LLYFVGLFFFFGETQPTVKIFVAAAARVTSGKYRYALSHKFSALKNKRRKKKKSKAQKKKQTRLYTQKMSNKSQSTPIKSNINFIRARQNKKHIPSILCEAQKCIGGVYCCFAVCSCNAKAFMSFMKRTNNI